MPGESLHFVCPLCGQHAPLERITQDGVHEFVVYRKVLGGKRPLTPEDRRRLKGHRRGRGSAAGALDYRPVRTLKAHKDALARRIKELAI